MDEEVNAESNQAVNICRGRTVPDWRSADKPPLQLAAMSSKESERNASAQQTLDSKSQWGCPGALR